MNAETVHPGEAPRAGPILSFRHAGEDRVGLAAIVIVPEGEAPGEVSTAEGPVPPEHLATLGVADVVRYRFELPARADAWYAFGGERFRVDCAYGGDLRFGYVSCNGQEHGDETRPDAERNVMWRRLRERHAAAPLHLLLHGGDQIYADEVTEAHPLSARWPKHVPDIGPQEASALKATLAEAFFSRYLAHFTQPDFAHLAARVPSLAMWDDHDICDGWGSLAVDKLDSALGKALFAAARETFLMFQLGAAPDEVPPFCLDGDGESLTFAVHLPGVSIIAPDLRSERRPHRVMGEKGWAACRQALAAARGRVLVLSSVPALGPRLSLVERLMGLTPWMEKYEDDLRDQWQSLAHREEWRAFLSALMAVHERPDSSVTVVSGEIHLATHATMATVAGDLHQLVASGVSHPAPPAAYARALGVLASFGEAPLGGHPIRLGGLPGYPRRYAAERNFLVIERRAGEWSAFWDLETSGATPALAI
jgi:hypothetical protein